MGAVAAARGVSSGVLQGHPDLRWREGIATRLDWADDRLWLLVEPRTVFDGITEQNKGEAADFARERSVKRYNRQLNDFIALWAGSLAGGGRDLRSLSVGEGVDAVFRLSPGTAPVLAPDELRDGSPLSRSDPDRKEQDDEPPNLQQPRRPLQPRYRARDRRPREGRPALAEALERGKRCRAGRATASAQRRALSRHQCPRAVGRG